MTCNLRSDPWQSPWALSIPAVAILKCGQNSLDRVGGQRAQETGLHDGEDGISKARFLWRGAALLFSNF